MAALEPRLQPTAAGRAQASGPDVVRGGAGTRPGRALAGGGLADSM